jgi:glutathione S-transferase
VKLYDATGPNPHVVRMFLAEKGVTLPSVVLALGIGDTLSRAHLARNPLGQVPVLELDSGQCISESTAICEYIEELHPKPPLFGATPEERAETRMWARRVDLNICQPIFKGYLFGVAQLRRYRVCSPVPMPPGPGAGLKQLAKNHLQWLDQQVIGRSFLCGDRFSFADVLLFCSLNYGIQVGQLLQPEWEAVRMWFDRVGARESAEISAKSRLDSPKALSGSVR